MNLGNGISPFHLVLLGGPGTEEECQKENPSCVGTQAHGSNGPENFHGKFFGQCGARTHDLEILSFILDGPC